MQTSAPSSFAGIFSPVLLAALAVSIAPVSAFAADAKTEAPPPPQPGEINRVVVRQGDTSTTFIQVAAEDPARRAERLRQRPAPPPVAPAPTAAELAEEKRLDAKAYQNLTLFAVVYPGFPVRTVLKWTGASGREWRAVSNIDFSLLTQVTNFETAAYCYDYFAFVENGDPLDSAKARWISFASPSASFVVDGTSPADLVTYAADFDALNYLHTYHDVHRTELVQAHAAREAENARRERELKETPPRKTNSVVRFAVSTASSPVAPSAKPSADKP